MTINTNDLLNSILDSLSRIDHAKLEALPDINLYMDQVITFMEKELYPTKRHEEDPILTKTMVNNYVKNNLLPPPEKKKYSKEHILTLVFIYYFKSVLSISDIQNVLNPLTDRYFGKKSSPTLEEIYDGIFCLESHQVERLKEIIQEEYIISESAFADLENLSEKDADFLQKFTFICLLNFDVYTKKLLIEKIIDSMKKPEPPKNTKRKRELIPIYGNIFVLPFFFYRYLDVGVKRCLTNCSCTSYSHNSTQYSHIVKLTLHFYATAHLPALSFWQTPYHNRHCHNSGNG